MPFTFKVGGEAEHVKVVLLLVSQAVASDAWQRVLAPAGLSGDVNRILNASVAQPPGVAPVQLSLPCLMQLIEGRHGGVLCLTGPLRIIEVQVVAAEAREIGKDDAYSSDMADDLQRNDTHLSVIYALGQVVSRTFVLPSSSRVTTAVPSSSPSITSHLYLP